MRCFLFAAAAFLSCSLQGNLSKFDDTLLVVHYNQAHFQSIPLLKEIYKDFPHIVFYGETPRADLAESAAPYLNEVILVPTHRGYFLTNVIADVLCRFPLYKGYIFMQDDVIMNYWNYGKYDKDKIWFSPSTFHQDVLNLDPEVSLVPAWDPTFDRSKTRREFYTPAHPAWCIWWKGYIDKVEAVLRRLPEKDLQIMERNVGRDGRVGMVCDMFYLPGKYREDAIRLSYLYSDVFCEIAVPMMLVCLADFSEWEFLRGIWAYHKKTEIPDLEYPLDADWIHGFKFSKQINRDFARYIIKRGLASSP
jgi:hypothetical protein